MLRMGVALLAIVGHATLARAQYHVDSWTTDDGLPQNVITGIHQTEDGYLWIATLDGLARFDGVRFTIFNKTNTPDIHNNRFTALYPDRQGHLWLGTEVGTVTRYTGERFITYTAAHGLPRSLVTGFTGDEAGHVWVLSDGTIRQWKPSRERFVEVDAPHVAGGYQPLEWSDRGGFWGADAAGLRRFVGGRWERHPLPAPLLAETSHVAEAQDGTTWVATPDGLLTRIENGESVGLGAASTRKFPLQWRAPSGASWALEVGQDLLRSLTLASSDHQVTITPSALYEDTEGNLWLGTDGQGLYRARKQLVTVYSRPQGLVGRNVYPIVQDQAGAIWIGAWSGGLSRFQDGRFTSYTAHDGLERGGVTALHEDADGRMWVATTQGGLQTFHDGRFTAVGDDFPPMDTQVHVIHQDRSGAIWLGTDHGLVRRLDGVTTVFTTRDGLATDNVRVIIEPAAGNRLWIGGYGGLTLWQDGRFTSWTESDGLPGSTIRALYEDDAHALWIGTYDSGLARLHEGRFTHYTTEDGLFNAGAFQILDDRRGNLWMCSNRGIYRVSRQELEEFAAGERTEIASIAYGKGDGMLNAECNGGMWPAGIRARDGTLWFPTQDGVAVIDPASVTTNTQPPSVVIESLLLDREPVPLPAVDRPLRIPPTRATFEIQYVGLSFINSERVRFRHRLAGLDDDWVEAGTRRTAYYSYVPPGSYTFTVIAANRDGVWSSEGASLELVVLPPFYRTWWFLTLTMTGAVGLVATAWRRRASRLKRAHATQRAFSRQLIASQEAERKRIAAELHDSLGQRLVIIKNLAMLASGVDGDRHGERVEEISAEASQAIGEVREIAQNLRPHHLDHLGLTKALEALVRKAANASTVRFAAGVDGIDGLFPKEAEINVYRAVQECVNNILKHSGASTASVTARRSPSQLLITVQDDGRGFAPAAGSHPPGRGGFGLLGMQERVTLLGGRLDIRSAPGEGTTVAMAFDVAKLRETQASTNDATVERLEDDHHGR